MVLLLMAYLYYIFNSNILSYGINEGFLRSIYTIFNVNGIDNESLVKISLILNSPIEIEMADKVIKVKSGLIESITINKEKKSVEEIDW